MESTMRVFCQHYSNSKNLLRQYLHNNFDLFSAAFLATRNEDKFATENIFCHIFKVFVVELNTVST